MTREELSRDFWHYYLMLEQKFITTTNYVKLVKSNFGTCSNEFALLLQAIGAELDNFFKVYCGFNSADRKNIADYAGYILADYPTITSQKVKVVGTDMEITPFEGWDISAPAKSLTWWDAFDCIKHNRHGNFMVANQESVLNILDGLYLLEMKQFSKVERRGEHHLEEPDNPDEQSKLFSLEDWTFRYVKLSDSFVICDGKLYCICEE